VPKDDVLGVEVFQEGGHAGDHTVVVLEGEADVNQQVVEVEAAVVVAKD